MVARIQDPTDVRIPHPVDMALRKAHRHRVARIMRAATRSTSRGESAHGPLVESVPPFHRGPLDACRFQGRDAAGPLAAGRLRDGHPLDRTRGIPPSLAAVCQVLQMSLQVLAIGRPRLSINARSRLVLPPVLRFAQAVAIVDRVPERRQRRRVVPPRCLS